MRWKRSTLLIAGGLTMLLAGPASAAGGPANADEQTLKNARVATDDASLLELFRKQTHVSADREKVQALVRQLGDDAYEVREHASNELAALGALAKPLLEQALRDADPEVVYRARDCLQRIKGEKGSNAPVHAAASRLLATRRPAGAAEALLSFLPSADEGVAEEIRTSLTALAVRDGKPEPVLVAALADREPVKRAAAAEAVCRANVVEQMPAVRKLLHDPEPAVRVPVALCLLARKEADALPVLIALLGEAPATQAWKVEEALRQLAGGMSPLVPAVHDPGSAQSVWEAWWRSQDGPALVDFFRKRTLPDAERDKMAALVRQLADASAEVRDKAAKELIARGLPVVALLRKAIRDSDADVARRAEECLQAITKDYEGVDLAPAAARLLALRRPAGADEALLAYLSPTEDDAVVEEIVAALATLAGHDDKAAGLLASTLADRTSLRRAVAADALGRAGVGKHRAALKKLLQDPDASVRLRVALTLAAARDKEAIPVLIALVGELPLPMAWQAESFLVRLAGGQPPEAPLGMDEDSRKKGRDAWSAWWRANESKVDLARLEGAPRLLGFTLVVLLDSGRAVELDAEGKPRWQIKDLQQPLDAQLLPGDRLLTAEHSGNRVTERNLKGEVVWEKKIDGPLAAQRLPNGNTFIATRAQLIEVDREGRELFTHYPATDTVMRAQKLANGDIACVTGTQEPHFVLLDGRGRLARTFPVNVNTSGGRIEVLPNGRALIPIHLSDKVVEYDGQGKAVRELTVERPIAAVRLANGDTLVTLMRQNRAVELDRNGKEVWQYKTDERVTRAFRR